MTKLYAKLYSCPCVHPCVSFPLRLLTCHRARSGPQVILLWGLCGGSLRTEADSEPFSLKCSPHYILKCLTFLTTVTHSGVAHYLPCPITPSVRPKRKYITCFILTTPTPTVTVGMRWCHECINCAADQFPHSAFYTVALWTRSYFWPPCAWLSRLLPTSLLKRTHHWQRQWANFVGLFFHLRTTDTRSTRLQINGYGQLTHAERRAPQHTSQLAYSNHGHKVQNKHQLHSPSWGIKTKTT